MTKILLNILGEKWESKGETILEALQGIDLTWDQIKGKGVLTITQGKTSHEHLFGMHKLRRLFSNKVMMTYWAKNLEYLLVAGSKTNVPQ